MIKINLNPRFEGDKTEASINGTVLTLNGTEYDLSQLPDGATAQHPMLGEVSRNGDDYELTITLTNGFNAPYDVRFPQPIEVTENTWSLEYEYDVMPEVVEELLEEPQNDLAE